jgi:1-phosphofructokinase
MVEWVLSNERNRIMVVTVTLNPALDVTARLDNLRPGETNRLAGVTVNAGGKGINAARLIQTLGGKVVAAGFGDARFIESIGDLDCRFIQTEHTRINMKLLHLSGGMTELNSPGNPVGAAAYRDMEDLLTGLAVPGTVFVLSGSLPPDADPGLYAGYIRQLKDKGCKTVLDTSGEALRLGTLAQPDVVKPNRGEMAVIAALPYTGLLARSLGAEGAEFTSGGRVLFIENLDLGVVSPAGAGDCMTGALAYALDIGLPFEEAALLSCAAANAAVTMAGTLCPPLDLILDCKERLHDRLPPA